jgi:hypothetical protein
VQTVVYSVAEGQILTIQVYLTFHWNLTIFSSYVRRSQREKIARLRNLNFSLTPWDRKFNLSQHRRPCVSRTATRQQNIQLVTRSVNRWLSINATLKRTAMNGATGHHKMRHDCSTHSMNVRDELFTYHIHHHVVLRLRNELRTHL